MISLLRMVGFRRLVAAVLAAVLADAAGIALVGTATWLLVRAAQRPDLAALSLGIATVRAAATIRGFARYGERLISHDAALGALARLRGRVYGTLAGRSPVNVSALRAGGVLGSVVHDADAVQDLVVRCVIPAAGAVLVAVTSVVAAWLVLPAVVPVLATGLVVALVPIPALAVLATRRSDRLVAADRADLTSRVVDLLRGGAEVAVAGGTVRAEVDRAADRLTRRQRKAPALGATSAVLFVAGITAVAVLAVGAPRAAVQAVVFTLLTLAAFDSCVPLPTAARHLARIAGSVGRLDGLLGPTPPAGERPDVHTGRELVLRQVNIRYAASDDPALDSLDLRVPPGHWVAVVGASGAGKSTLLSAIARFVTPAGGRITLGGIDLDAWPEEQLRRTVGGVLADAHVFHDTIAANLRIGRPDATDAELVAVARRVRLLDWIESLPNRWRTVLGEDAALSSGGQRGRLLLARALLADPPVLLLDEPTEGLDAATADAVLADLLSATEGRSVVLVTHRLAGLAAMDEVVVLDGGRVRQRGAHARLLDEPGPYRELWRVHELVG